MKLILVASLASQIWKLYLIPRLASQLNSLALCLPGISKAGILVLWWVLSGYYWEVKQILTPSIMNLNYRPQAKLEVVLSD